MASTSVAFSTLIRQKDDDVEDVEPKSKKREEWKKAKKLEEERKAGTVAAAVDEEGRDVNPHIPQYISSAPWYLGTTGPTLKHQRPQEEHQKQFNNLNEHFVRGLQGDKARKYRKGACENCGAMGHKKKDCLERPRKVGAKYSNKVIAHDDVALPDLSLNYDGKRDRWNGYDATQYEEVVEEYNKIEDCKRQLKANKLQAEDEIEEEQADLTDDEDKYAESSDMPGTKVDSKQRITVRNLRIREDTAKYLRNLDINSAHYDPKTRSMRVNPYLNTNKSSDQVDFAGDSFVRFSGDTAAQAQAQLFAWEASEKGVDVSLLAEPTKLEILQKQYKIKKEQFKESVAEDLLEKYGGKEHLKVPPKELLLAQTENYIEYSRQGKIIKGNETEKITSRYTEDVFPNNHMSVWGSYWREGYWGYKCCHSFTKNSYCTGEAGKSQNNDWTTKIPVQETVKKESPVKSLLQLHRDQKKKAESEDNSDSDDGLTAEEIHKKRLREALIKAKKEEETGKKLLNTSEKKRKYHSLDADEKQLSEIEIEAYKIRKVRTEDPMADFK